jgi:hypothetical protein
MIIKKKLYKLIFLFVLTLTSSLICQTTLFGQKTEYKHYTNLTNKFSFDIPKTWKIYYSKKQESIICVPTTLTEKESYEDCLEGIIFRLDIHKSGLDSTLLNDNYYKVENEYYTTDRIHDSVKTKQISGKTWKGIYHKNVCGISCKDNGFHAGAGECEFLYFSSSSTTVCINTNGRAFDDKILEKIIRTFHFIKS